MAFRNKPTDIIQLACEHYENPKGIRILKSCRSCKKCVTTISRGKNGETEHRSCSVYRFATDASQCCPLWAPTENAIRAGRAEGQMSKYASRYEALTEWVESQLRIVEKIKKGRDDLDEATAQEVRSIMEKVDEVMEIMESIPEEERKLTTQEITGDIRASSVEEDENGEDALMDAAREFCKSCKTKRKGGRLVKTKWPGGKCVKKSSLPKERRKDKDVPATIQLNYHEITTWVP